MVNLKREQEILAKLKENEEKAMMEKEKYKSVILQQIKRSEENRRNELKYRREVPDIVGQEGYPRIHQPSWNQEREMTKTFYKQQQETLLRQVTIVIY